MGTKYTTQSLTGYNSSPPSDDGTVVASNQLKWANHTSKIGDPLKNQIAAIDSALVTALNVGPQSYNTSTSLLASHNSQFIQVSGSAVTLTLSDASTLGAGWWCTLANTDSSNTVTIGRATSGDTINGTAANISLYPNTTMTLFVVAAANGFWVVGDVTSRGNNVFSGNNNFPTVQGAFKNLQASANGTGANVSVSADEVVVENSSNSYTTLRTVSLTINTAASGANGLDTGTLAGSTWYSVWVIYNPTTVTTAGLISTSATAPTMPSGYTHKARIGWIRTDGTANKYPLSFKQYCRRVQYVVSAGSNVTAVPAIISGISGNISTPTWTSASVSSFVPSTAARISIVVSIGTTIVAPNNSYGAYNSATIPPPIMLFPSGSTTSNVFSEFLLEGTNIYYASNAAAASAMCLGWEDNL